MGSLIALGGDRASSAADRSGEAGDRHQPGYLMAADVVTSVFHHVPHLADTVDTPIGHVHRVYGVRGMTSATSAETRPRVSAL